MQISIGSGGSSLRAAFRGGAGGISYSITTDPDADQAALQATVRKKLDAITDAGDVSIAAAGGGFASSNIDVDVRPAARPTSRRRRMPWSPPSPS